MFINSDSSVSVKLMLPAFKIPALLTRTSIFLDEVIIDVSVDSTSLGLLKSTLTVFILHDVYNRASSDFVRVRFSLFKDSRINEYPC